tara:strand:- start:34130 stop:34966 length:837 start_codon:yes stop_codon:yes gene_type:complete
MCPRALLFVPASRPDRIHKALATNADMVCVDLEDGVDLDSKDSARESLLAFLSSANFDADRLSVRVNNPVSDLGQQDLMAIAGLHQPVKRLLLPKVADTETIEAVSEVCPHVEESIVIIETSKGLSNVFALAAHQKVSAVCFGSADWSTEVGCSMEWDALLYARSRIIHAAAEGGSAPIDGAWLQLDDEEGLETESRQLRSLGFLGRIALHPRQITAILRSFTPDASTIEQAKQVLEASAQNSTGAFQINGLMVDEPIIRRARRVLESVGISCSDATK